MCLGAPTGLSLANHLPQLSSMWTQASADQEDTVSVGFFVCLVEL